MKEAKSAGPWIVAMKGHPGTGKSTLAQSLASSLNCPLLDKDDVRDSTSTLQLSISPKLLNDLSYDVVWRLASTQLRLGLSVVIDSPLSRRPYLDRLLELAADAGARLVIVECKSNDEAEWRRRLERRGAAEGSSWHKPTTWRDLEKLLEGYGGCTQYDVGDVPKLVLDTTAPVGVKEHVSAVLRQRQGDPLGGCDHLIKLGFPGMLSMNSHIDNPNLIHLVRYSEDEMTLRFHLHQISCIRGVISI